MTTPFETGSKRRGQAQASAVWHRADAVGGEIPDDLLDLPLVGLVPQLLRRHVDVDQMPVVHVGAVAQQGRRVAQRAADVEAGDGEALRPRIGEKRSNRVVEAVGLAQHDVHQLLLLGAERQLLTKNLDRPRHRRQRVANLVGHPGGHLADGGQPLLQRGIALEPLDLRHVLKTEEKPGPSARRDEVGRAQAEHDLAAAVGGPVEELPPPRPAVTKVVAERLEHGRRQLQHLGDRPSERGKRRHAGNEGRRHG